MQLGMTVIQLECACKALCGAAQPCSSLHMMVAASRP
jgi:hypothetical protein